MATATDSPLRQLVARIVADQPNRPAADKVALLDLCLKTMALVACADAHIDDAELKMLEEMQGFQGDRGAGSGAIQRILNEVKAQPEIVWQDLERAGHLTVLLREDLFRVAALTAAADGRVHESESAVLLRIGDMLDLDRTQSDSILQTLRPEPAHPDRTLHARALSLLLQSRGGKVLSGIFDRLRRDTEDGLSPRQRKQALELTVKAMALMALVDRDVQEAELRLTGEIYAALGGGKIGIKTLSRAVAVVGEEQLRALQSFDDSSGLDQHTREDIVRAAFRLAQVDGKVEPRECALLEELCDRLGLGASKAMDIAAC